MKGAFFTAGEEDRDLYRKDDVVLVEDASGESLIHLAMSSGHRRVECNVAADEAIDQRIVPGAGSSFFTTVHPGDAIAAPALPREAPETRNRCRILKEAVIGYSGGYNGGDSGGVIFVYAAGSLIAVHTAQLGAEVLSLVCSDSEPERTAFLKAGDEPVVFVRKDAILCVTGHVKGSVLWLTPHQYAVSTNLPTESLAERLV